MEGRDEHGRFKKGEYKGGPGRPKVGYALPEMMRAALEAESTENPNASELKQIIKALFVEAKSGNIEAAKLIFNRAYGKEADVIQIENTQEPDFSKLTNEELSLYITLLEKAESEYIN